LIFGNKTIGSINKEDLKMVKGFRQIAFLTTVSRVLGMLRDICFAHFFGAGWLMTAWTMGFKIPNLARRLFGEGAASASFIPVYSEQLYKDPEQAKKLRNTVITVILVILAIIVLVGEILVWGYYGLFETRVGPRTGLSLCGIMLPYMIFVCTVAILAGILNVHRHFAAPACAPLILNTFIIGSILFSGWVLKLQAQQQVFFVAAFVLVAGLTQTAFQLPFLRSKDVSIRPAWDVHSESFRKVIAMMGPMIIGLTVTQINTLADDLIALSFMAKDGYPLSYGAPSYLYYAQRTYQFPLGVLGISLATAIFPVMSADAARSNFDALNKTIAKGLRSAVFVAIPATAGIFIVSGILISALFEHGQFKSDDTPIVALTLCFYSVGLCGYFTQQIATRAYYSIQDAKTPVRSAIIAVIVNVILNLILIWPLGTAGLALSTAVCSYLQVAILLGKLRKKIGRPITNGIQATLLKTVLAAVVMSIFALAILYLMRNLAQTRIFNVARLGVVVPASAVVFYFTAKILGIGELSLLMGGGRKTEDRGQRTEDGRQRTEDRRRKTEDRRQRTEDGRQRTEDRGRKTEDRGQ
jgi:putative peptidoglycan lipid II flippase